MCSSDLFPSHDTRCGWNCYMGGVLADDNHSYVKEDVKDGYLLVSLDKGTVECGQVG